MEPLDFSKFNNMTFDFDSSDFPEFTDTLVTSADYDGIVATDEQLEILNSADEFVYNSLLSYLY